MATASPLPGSIGLATRPQRTENRCLKVAGFAETER